MVTGSLFDDPQSEASSLRGRLTGALSRLAGESVLIGTSSWKYEGWLDQIYTRSNYTTRGKFSKKAFEAECLREYAEIFPTVCGDFSFYQFPSEDFWKRLFQATPSSFQFAFKVPEQITCRVFPPHPRYGAQAGLENPSFLDAYLLHEAFLRILAPYKDRIAVLIFEFGAFSRGLFPSAAEFLELLDPFLASLPRDLRYAVEIRNEEFLRPEYFACLRSHGVAHVLNAWSRMPELQSQLEIPDVLTADFLISRALLRRGRVYEDAVRTFSPYKSVQDPNPEARSALRQMIEIARAKRQRAFLYVNNRLEGNAPQTIMAVAEPGE